MNAAIREAAAAEVERAAHPATAEQKALIASQLAPSVAQAASKTHDAAKNTAA